MKIYLGTPGWGWKMYGIGYKTKWFFGLSIQDKRQEGSESNADQA